MRLNFYYNLNFLSYKDFTLNKPIFKIYTMLLSIISDRLKKMDLILQ